MSSLSLGTVRVYVNYQNGRYASVSMTAQDYLAMHAAHVRLTSILFGKAVSEGETIPAGMWSGRSTEGLPFELRIGTEVVSLTAESE